VNTDDLAVLGNDRPTGVAGIGVGEMGQDWAE
jgi:hypothetical protein